MPIIDIITNLPDEKVPQDLEVRLTQLIAQQFDKDPAVSEF